MNLFRINSPLYQAMSRLTELMILNVMWIICCLPVVTIGAANTALYTVLMRQDRRNSTAKTFLQAFVKNFKSSLPLTGLMAVMAAAAGAAYLIFLSGDMQEIKVADVLPALVMVMFFCINSYVWALHALFVNTTMQTLQNALLLSLAHFPSSLLMAALNMVPFAWLLYATQSFMKFLMFWLLIGFAIVADLSARILKPILDKHLSAETQEETENGL